MGTHNCLCDLWGHMEIIILLNKDILEADGLGTASFKVPVSLDGMLKEKVTVFVGFHQNYVFYQF